MWKRVPLSIRAIIIGLIVAGVPAFVWSALVAINLRTDPRIPWSAPFMAVALWLYWRYLARFRTEYLRAVTPEPRVSRLALLAGGSAVAALWALFAALRGVLHIAAPANDVTRYPLLTVVAAILVGSAVAAIAEEAGFRGFMQVPLERAYGPGIAIATTSVLFTLAHATHGWRILPFMPFYLAVGVVYGLLAFLTGSILPSLTLHFIGDVLTFTIRYIAARQGLPGSAATGAISLVYAVAAAAFIVLSVLAFRVLARETRAVAAPPGSAEAPV